MVMGEGEEKAEGRERSVAVKELRDKNQMTERKWESLVLILQNPLRGCRWAVPTKAHLLGKKVRQ